MKIKKLFVYILCCTLLFGNIVSANAEEDHIFTTEEIESIIENNKSIDEYIYMKNLTRASGGKTLSMTPIKQIGKSNCGPVVVCMISKTLGLGNYTEDEMAIMVGTDPDKGSSSYQIKNTLNELLKNAGRSGRYEVTTTSMSDLLSSIIYSIDNDFPVVVNVKVMPKYAVNSGHFIAVNGYYWGMSGSNAEAKITYCDSHPNFWGSETISIEEMVAACNSNGGTFTRLSQ